MRILAMETSSRRGSVTLLENDRAVASLEHEQANQHAERLLPMVESLLQEADWSRASLNRVAVGIGPGSFTGVRVGMALAEGLSLGLGIATTGICSLEAMAAAVPPTLPGIRIACLDARRGEVFNAAYAEMSTGMDANAVRCEPRVLPAETALGQVLADLGQPEHWILCGELAPQLTAASQLSAADADVQFPAERAHRSRDSDLPHALWVGRLAALKPTHRDVAQPMYLRGANATRPNLPASPLTGPRR